jgi:hypothetical protein
MIKGGSRQAVATIAASQRRERFITSGLMPSKQIFKGQVSSELVGANHFDRRSNAS